MATVRDCLAQKLDRIIHVAPSESVHAALELMKSHKVRSILVVEHDRLLGIVTQGDCAIRAFLPGRDARQTPVGDIMTREPMTVSSGDRMEACMGLMANRGFRHLPVVDGGRVVGVISIGDVVKNIISELGVQVSFLETYIRGHGA